MAAPKRMIVGVTGATGIPLAVRTLEILQEQGVESHLILSKAAEVTIAYETDHKVQFLKDLADFVYDEKDIAGAPASGSFKTMGMIVVPCSMHSLAEVAQGLCSNLLTRAADVTLKERRRLVLCVRETPFNLAHLRNMQAVTEMGGIIAPPMQTFYPRPESIAEMIDHTVGRMLDLFDMDAGVVKRWGEETGKKPRA